MLDLKRIRIFGAASERQLALVRCGLALLIGARIMLWPFTSLAELPAGLFDPPWFLAVLPTMPSRSGLLALQVAGGAAALLAASGRGVRVAMPAAWLAFLVLAGCKTSTGKLLHNDVALILAAMPFLWAPADARTSGTRRGVRYGWPLDAAAAALALLYATTAVQKGVHTGIDWVFSDNMRWILYTAAAGDRGPAPDLARFVADRAWLATAAAGALVAIELGFLLVIVSRRLRPVFALAAVLLHGGTWLLLGLDYWAWSVTAVLVLAVPALPWATSVNRAT